MSASESERLLAGKNGERLRASIAQLGGWQPIETAPKDGTPILAFEAGTPANHRRDVPLVAYWEDGTIGSEAGWWGYWQTEQMSPHKPTHWMPLPNPPA